MSGPIKKTYFVRMDDPIIYQAVWDSTDLLFTDFFTISGILLPLIKNNCGCIHAYAFTHCCGLLKIAASLFLDYWCIAQHSQILSQEFKAMWPFTI